MPKIFHIIYNNKVFRRKAANLVQTRLNCVSSLKYILKRYVNKHKLTSVKIKITISFEKILHNNYCLALTKLRKTNSYNFLHYRINFRTNYIQFYYVNKIFCEFIELSPTGKDMMIYFKFFVISNIFFVILNIFFEIQ
jgi:hypothetical protein